MSSITIQPLEQGHLPALRAFLDALPDHDVTFIKEDVRDPATAEAWVRSGDAARRWLAISDGDADHAPAQRVVGLAMVVPLPGWSSHVGSLRLVVDESARGRGLGRALARHALQAALSMKLRKIVVEVVAEQESAVRLFDELGFRGEALLSEHIRDRTGEFRDLLVLAHDVDEHWSALASLGVPDELH